MPRDNYIPMLNGLMFEFPLLTSFPETLNGSRMEVFFIAQKVKLCEFPSKAGGLPVLIIFSVFFGSYKNHSHRSPPKLSPEANCCSCKTSFGLIRVSRMAGIKLSRSALSPVRWNEAFQEEGRKQLECRGKVFIYFYGIVLRVRGCIKNGNNPMSKP